MKKEYAKCFIKENNEYIEITYDVLLQRSTIYPEYKKKRFIPLHGMLMEVNETDYKFFYKDIRREKYQREEAISHGEVSYHSLDTDEMSGEEIIIDTSLDVEREASIRIQLEKLNRMRLLLDPAEQELVYLIYDKGIPETQVAVIKGVSQQAISKRLNKIHNKLKKLMNI